PGSGKSFFASRLATLAKGEYLNSDQVRIKLFKKREYTEAEKELVYDVMFERAKKAHEEKSNLVIDATFYKQHLRQRYLDELPGSVSFIEVVAQTKLVKKRLSMARAFSEADYKIYKAIKKEWEPFETKHLTLTSTNDNIGEMLDKAALYLNLGNDK
ncbi:MAG: AAA family ATPase, partial [Cyclobacteriaceae bacterium]